MQWQGEREVQTTHEHPRDCEASEWTLESVGKLKTRTGNFPDPLNATSFPKMTKAS